MADSGNRATDSLEDQLRRMILSGSLPESAGQFPSNSTTSPHATERPVRNVRPQHDSQSQRDNRSNNKPVHHHHQASGSSFSLEKRGPQPAQPSVVANPPVTLSHFYKLDRNRTTNQPVASHNNHSSSRQSRSQQTPMDAATFQRTYMPHGHYRQSQGPKHLFQPNQGPSHTGYTPRHIALERQAQYLSRIADEEIAQLQMTQSEQDEKDAFRVTLQKVCHDISVANPGRIPSASLKCFGSFQSGFATAGSDMDLVIVVDEQSMASVCFSLQEEDLPRTLEKQLLQLGYGARLLTRTRVPIIKLCQKPGAELLGKLREERAKWDALSDREKYPHLYPQQETTESIDLELRLEMDKQSGKADDISTSPDVIRAIDHNLPRTSEAGEAGKDASGNDGGDYSVAHTVDSLSSIEPQKSTLQQTPRGKRETSQVWTRERNAGPLDFPKSGVGIQSDINFFNPLGLHNTQMLRCYSLCDPRVRPMVLLVKAWAKRRKVNSSYSGTLSSYGFVLMLLHYLVNVVGPPVLPNLQMPWRPNSQCTPHGACQVQVDGWDVNFWDREDEINKAAQQGQMTSNTSSIGQLLAGFFQYYSSMGNGPQFRWTQSVLSIRTPGGILTKEGKGWVKATTEEGDGRRIQHRYLFCIEDPFELSHNVARTVTHNGIVAIRDEFRRAFRILVTIGNGMVSSEGEIFDRLVDLEVTHSPTQSVNTLEAAKGRRARTPQPRPEKLSSSESGTSQEPAATKPIPRVEQGTLNLSDVSTFPKLGTVKDKKKSSHNPEGTFGEISGDRAKVFLQELRRKKAEKGL